jgi:transcriptional regulator
VPVYLPKAFEETRVEVLQALMRRHSFGTVVSHGVGGLIATHLPLMLDAERGARGTLMGHVARANPHWQQFQENAEALAIFQGPHAYVSPSWYETDPSVPTWNYVAVHAYGRPSLIESDERLYGLLEAMVATYEAGRERPWDLASRAEFVRRQMKAIVGFEMPIARLEGKLKLSQNRSTADREGAVAGLLRQGDAESVAVAELMTRSLRENGSDA